MLIHQLPYLSTKSVVLASQSPRRTEILRMAGVLHTVRKPQFAEDLPKARYGSPAAYAEATAHAKAVAVLAEIRAESVAQTPDLLIASDTIVVRDADILEKPRSEAEAISMLQSLSGRRHSVVTAVALVARGGPIHCFASETAVWFDELSDDLIHAYVRGGEPMDKAGAYGIQGQGGAFVSRIEGCYFTVMGLPLHALSKHIRKLVDDGLV